MNKKRMIPVVVLLAVLAACAVHYAKKQSPSGNPDAIAVSGNIEVIDAELSFKIAGRVASRSTDEGERVTAGQEIARLDDAELVQDLARRKAELEQASANLAELKAGARPQEKAEADAAVAAAKARVDELRHGSRVQEIASARADVAWSKAEVDRLRKDDDRYRKLHEASAISAQQWDAAHAASVVATERLTGSQERFKLVQEGPRKEQIEQAEAALRQVEEKRALVFEGPRAETIAQAAARCAQSEAAVKLAEIQVQNARLLAPSDGVVLSKTTEPGEFVAPGTPIVTIGDIDHVFLRAYIDESDLGRVKLGQTAVITTDTYPGKSYTGKITFIAPQAEFTPKSVQTAKERVKLVYRVKIEVPNPEHELKPGMPADAAITAN